MGSSGGTMGSAGDAPTGDSVSNTRHRAIHPSTRPPPIGNPCSIRSPPIDIITAPSGHHRSTYPCSTKPPPIDFIFAPPGHHRMILFQMPLRNTEMSTREVNLSALALSCIVEGRDSRVEGRLINDYIEFFFALQIFNLYT
ncbi:hypothetical protein E3N88_13289 [Mikania micrantha]|uniref:Uncharacterized protein n=1 Tax=Mikania micrantha TaxID=192012 RepID=A0A5N6P820_9ASTR|nr:hypothetical protein E3N88_13289 [Mikania micrantha]